jgi:signal transduction histidine kinase
LEFPGTQDDIKHRFHLKDFPVLKKMVHTKQPALLPDTGQDADWTVVKSLAWSRSFLSAPLLVEKQVIGFVNLFSAQPLFFTQAMCDRLVAFASHAAVAIQNAWLFERVRSGSERLQSLSRRLVEIQENERLYIARELHDEAGQMLTSLMVDLRVLEKDAGQTQLVLEKVAEMETSLNEVFESLHRVAMALRPATLDHLGLVAALHQYVESIGEKHNLKISFMSEKLRERLPANMETVLYRIAQEALTNVVRHAHATQVDVVLTLRDDKLILIIEDDGTGFDPEKVSDGGHLGLFGMRERTETINGKLVIESAPGKGTTVMVEVEYGDTLIEHRAGTYPISQ